MHLITLIKAFRWSAVVGTVELLCLIVLLACGSGCKSGTSMGSSWGSLGMGGPDPATLAECSDKGAKPRRHRPETRASIRPACESPYAHKHASENAQLPPHPASWVLRCGPLARIPGERPGPQFTCWAPGGRGHMPTPKIGDVLVRRQQATVLSCKRC